MTTYSIGVSKTAPASGSAAAILRAAAADDVQIREIGVFNSTGVASSIGLIRTLTAGTPSTSSLVQGGDPQRPAGTMNVDTAWSVAPTISVAPLYLRKIVLPATIGAGVIWTFGPNELWTKNGATTDLALWNFGGGAAAALELYVVVDE